MLHRHRAGDGVDDQLTHRGLRSQVAVENTYHWEGKHVNGDELGRDPPRFPESSYRQAQGLVGHGEHHVRLTANVIVKRLVPQRNVRRSGGSHLHRSGWAKLPMPFAGLEHRVCVLRGLLEKVRAQTLVGRGTGAGHVERGP
jgi:hypothetical protein